MFDVSETILICRRLGLLSRQEEECFMKMAKTLCYGISIIHLLPTISQDSNSDNVLLQSSPIAQTIVHNLYMNFRGTLSSS